MLGVSARSHSVVVLGYTILWLHHVQASALPSATDGLLKRQSLLHKSSQFDSTRISVLNCARDMTIHVATQTLCAAYFKSDLPGVV